MVFLRANGRQSPDAAIRRCAPSPYGCGMDRGSEAEISLALDAKNALCVERAVMDVVEL